MWFMKCKERTFYIRCDKQELFIGRSAEVCDLVLNGDSSISRRHGVLRIDKENQLTLQDLGSKYGTYVNENIEMKNPIGKEMCIILKDNDRIRLGTLENVWTVKSLSLVTCTSTLKGENLEEIKKDLQIIGASFKADWDESCTHLTMPAITLTAKVLAALAYQRQIVTPEFWKSWKNTVINGGDQPNPSNYFPEIIENTLNKENVSFAPDVKRKSLFIGKKFIFFSRKQMNLYKIVLERCGASVGLLSESKLTKSKLCGDDIIVIQYSVSLSGQDSQSQQQIIGDIVNYMSSKSRRLIPDAEIGLAVLLMSTEKYCNPKRNLLAMFNQADPQVDNKNAKILAPETQDSSSSKKQQNDVVIDESLVSMNNDTTANSSEEMFKELNRPKRKLPVADNTSDNVSKKPNLNDSTYRSKGSDREIFNFASEAPQTSASSSLNKSPGKKLSFLKPKSKKTNMQEDFFNFLSDDTNKEQPSPSKSMMQSSLFSGASNKRKLQSKEEPVAKKNHTELHNKSDKFEVKANFDELLKHSFWKSCAEETAKQQVKLEPDECDDSKLDCGEAVVSMRDDLVVKSKNYDSHVFKEDSYAGVNFKRFKKVLPLKMQVVVIPSTSMSIFREDPPENMEVQIESSDDDEDERVWKEQMEKGKKRTVSRR